MKHRRSPTHSYPQNTTPHSIHATLALRHPHSFIPTLLSPLRSIVNTPPQGGVDAFDDFQSNAWVDAPTYHTPLTGLGITYLCDASANLDGQSLSSEDPAFQMQIDCDGDFLFLSAGTREPDIPPGDFLVPSAPYGGSESEENRRVALCTSNFDPSLCGEPPSHLGPGLDRDIDPTASDIIGLIPDVNMYDKLRQLDLPHPGVNPLDTVHSTLLPDIGFFSNEPASLTLKHRHSDNVLSTTDSRVEQSPSPQVIQDIISILTKPAPEFSFLPWSSTNSPSAPSFSPAPRSSASINLEPSTVSDSEHYALPHLEYLDTTHSSPILNAHLGIELNELISRAERFKTKYPERDIDRAWLSHFAGKLSDRGELLTDFRCYIIGCDQRNKRRDHILVHVGAHIGQRPFACSVCPLRFLRKNECKRHEASHSGFRPYSCDICGQSFVRQDLVKRHVKRTHGLKDENDSGVAKQTRKRARLH